MPDIAALTAALTADVPATRAEAAEALCRAGTDAVAAAVPLVKACSDADDQVREWAVAALEELGPPPAATISELTALAGGAHPLVAYWATTLLGRSGKAAAAATPTLAKSLESAGDPAVAERAAWALGKIGPAAAAAKPALERSAASSSPRLSRLAQEALTAIGG